MARQQFPVNRREFLKTLAALPGVAASASAQSGPESFRVYTDAPRLFLRPARLRLLQRERERRSLRWDQFETLWLGAPPFPEFGWTAALRYRIAGDDSAGRQAVTWAAGASTDVRQIALVFDWCDALLSREDRAAIVKKLEKALTTPLGSLADARNVTLAAVALADVSQDATEKALGAVYREFWLGRFIPGLRSGRLQVSNSDANAMLELMHAFRDNLNFDLRETFEKWFRDYPLIHILAHYPEPFPAAENEYRIPADPELEKRGPDVVKATQSRAAELAMVAFDANAPETQLVQGFLMNDKFLMRGTLGITYELMWANPYQPGLSYYHVPLVAHDESGGQLYVRSSWEDDASWLSFSSGQLQLFADGKLVNLDSRIAHEPIDLTEATVYFARGGAKFRVPDRPKRPVQTTRVSEMEPDDEAAAPVDALDDVFIIGLEPGKLYHVETDGEGMLATNSDVGGIVYLPGMPAGAQVRFATAAI